MVIFYTFNNLVQGPAASCRGRNLQTRSARREPPPGWALERPGQGRSGLPAGPADRREIFHHFSHRRQCPGGSCTAILDDLELQKQLPRHTRLRRAPGTQAALPSAPAPSVPGSPEGAAHTAPGRATPRLPSLSRGVGASPPAPAPGACAVEGARSAGKAGGGRAPPSSPGAAPPRLRARWVPKAARPGLPRASRGLSRPPAQTRPRPACAPSARRFPSGSIAPGRPRPAWRERRGEGLPHATHGRAQHPAGGAVQPRPAALTLPTARH